MRHQNKVWRACQGQTTRPGVISNYNKLYTNRSSKPHTMFKIKAHTILFFAAVSILAGLTSCGHKAGSQGYLLVFNDTVKKGSGYKDQNGNIAILPGKYAACFTDTFRTFAIVEKPGSGFVAIDREEHILYQVFPFDNGPDYVSDGLFRVLENNKIGYADATSGKIVIKPQFGCAFPFDKSIAKVSTDCKTQTDGEHSAWVSDNWTYIDKTGNEIEK